MAEDEQRLRILISRCLLGEPVRYDGNSRPLNDPRLRRWQKEGRLIPVCPEHDGGLPTPRPPAEIVGGEGEDVLDRRARVINEKGADVTAAFLKGAHTALKAAQAAGCRFALLKARSPSCGCCGIYDGTFTGTLKQGRGVTAALLTRHGITVFDETKLNALEEALAREENGPDAEEKNKR